MWLKCLASFTKRTSVFCYFLVEFPDRFHTPIWRWKDEDCTYHYWSCSGMSYLLGTGNFLVESQLENQKWERKRFGISQSSTIVTSQKSCRLLVNIDIMHSLFIDTTCCNLHLYSTFCQQNTDIQFKTDL